MVTNGLWKAAPRQRKSNFTDNKKCMGCGICAHHCPENARSLERTGLRTVFIPPPKIAEQDLKPIQA